MHRLSVINTIKYFIAALLVLVVLFPFDALQLIDYTRNSLDHHSTLHDTVVKALEQKARDWFN